MDKILRARPVCGKPRGIQHDTGAQFLLHYEEKQSYTFWNNFIKGVYPKWNHEGKRRYRMLMDTQIYKWNVKIPDLREPQFDMWKW